MVTELSPHPTAKTDITTTAVRPRLLSLIVTPVLNLLVNKCQFPVSYKWPVQVACR